MILRVWEKCIEALPRDQVYVATDDDAIADHCNSHQMQVIRTSDACLTGTDRIAEASKSIDADIFINVQGDEPLICPDDISQVINASRSSPKSVINAYCEITDDDDFYSPNVPKVTISNAGKLLYMSRAAIPTDKKLTYSRANKQVCIYAFPRESLELFGPTQSKSPNEAIEDIEILRFLDHDFPVQMIAVSGSSIAVDTPQDAERVRARLGSGS